MLYKYEDFNEFSLEDMKNFLECKIKLKEIIDNGILEDIKDYLREQNNENDGHEGGCINDECNLLIERAVDLLNSENNNITRDIIKDEICNFINNTESEDYIKLTDEEIDNIAENIADKVLLDNDVNVVLTETIEWYVNHELYENGGKK